MRKWFKKLWCVQIHQHQPRKWTCFKTESGEHVHWCYACKIRRYPKCKVCSEIAKEVAANHRARSSYTPL